MQGIPDPDASSTSRLFVHLTGDVDVSTILKLGGYRRFDSFLSFCSLIVWYRLWLLRTD